ncbi:MAG: quinol:cytochrome C oxidoreductase [Verrucomicrobiota bacterium]
MSAHRELPTPPPLDLSRWRGVPMWLMLIGGLGAAIGWAVPSLRQQFAYSWLLAFMFFLSLCLGGMFLVLIHHLFDASWSVAIRRFEEHIACLLPVMAALFIPIAIFAPSIYPWMKLDPHADHALHAKQPLFTIPMFYVIAAFCFLAWWFFSRQLRSWSLKQDETGAALCTFKLRKWSAIGIFFFAVTLTLAAIMWMKALQHHWFSTMYGVYYFAGSVWTTIATVYMIAVLLQRSGPLRTVVHEETYYFLGSLQLAFTVFYAYIHFSQYFIIWNANMPEETFWYVLREKGSWWYIGMVIIFGHFFLPFLLLLRIDWKLKLPMMAFIWAWAWLMHFVDLSFNIMPVLHPDGFVLHWLDIACLAFIGGVLATVFIKSFAAHPPFPQKDPRFAETLKVYVPPVSAPVEPLAARGGGK